MKLLNIFGINKTKIREVEFQPSWDYRSDIMNILEKEGFNLGIRAGCYYTINK